mgnify:CR=1 FL=1
MLRINIPWIIDIRKSLERILEIEPGQRLDQVWGDIFDAQNKLQLIFDESIYGQYLRTSRDQAISLHRDLNIIKGYIEDNENYILNEVNVYTIRGQLQRFLTIFMAEIGTLPVYLVSRKEGYDVDVLIDSGTRLFPEKLISKVPEAESDSKEAGKALAFEVATACGFHVFRVTEAVVRRYWDHVSDGKERPHPQTLGKFASEMDGRFGDEKIIESVKQMTRLHRNPLIHPEVILSVDEAIGVVGIARSVVGAMLAVLPDAPKTTGA